MCNCFEEVLANVKEKLNSHKKAKHEVDWYGRVFRFDGGCGIGLYIEEEFYKIKKDGNLFANKTKQKRFMALSYCPFCGQSLKE